MDFKPPQITDDLSGRNEDSSNWNIVRQPPLIPANEELLAPRAADVQLRNIGSRRYVVPCRGSLECTNVVSHIVRRNWRLPPTIEGLDRLAVFTIKVDSQGVVHSLVLSEPSGDVLYDNACFRAIFGSMPFPIEIARNEMETEELSVVKLVFRSPGE